MIKNNYVSQISTFAYFNATVKAQSLEGSIKPIVLSLRSFHSHDSKAVKEQIREKNVSL